MSQERIGQPVKVAREAAFIHEEAHQNEERYHRQTVVLRGIHDEPRSQRDGGPEPALNGQADDTHDAHGERNRHSQKGEREHGGEADERFGHSLSSDALDGSEVALPAGSALMSTSAARTHSMAAAASVAAAMA